MTEKFTAKTIEEAKKLASKKFGVAESKIKFEIVEEGKRGFPRNRKERCGRQGYLYRRSSGCCKADCSCTGKS